MSEENALQQDAQAPGTTLKATQELLTRARAELGRVIAGQSEVIGEVLWPCSRKGMRCSKACRELPRR